MPRVDHLCRMRRYRGAEPRVKGFANVREERDEYGDVKDCGPSISFVEGSRLLASGVVPACAGHRCGYVGAPCGLAPSQRGL